MKKMIIIDDSSVPLMGTVASMKNIGNESVKICKLYQPMDFDKKDDSGGYKDV